MVTMMTAIMGAAVAAAALRAACLVCFALVVLGLAVSGVYRILNKKEPTNVALWSVRLSAVHPYQNS